jgi:hypothetical protein
VNAHDIFGAGFGALASFNDLVLESGLGGDDAFGVFIAGEEFSGGLAILSG